jgi:hypothetical protein
MTSITEYSPTEAALADLAERYKGVSFDIETREGMQAAIAGRAELRGYRVALEKKRKEIKAPALERCQLIDAEARRITIALEALEDPIDVQIKTEEARKENERLAAVRAEEARIAEEQRKIKEAEEARLQAEREEIAKRQAELDRAEAARVAAERESARVIEEQQRAARQRIEEEERAARLKREQADRQARVEREAEEREAAKLRAEEDTRLRQERERIESERQALAAQQRQAEEAKENERREIERQENELLDGRAMLEKFKERFGHRKEFAPVVTAINRYLKKQHYQKVSPVLTADDERGH